MMATTYARRLADAVLSMDLATERGLRARELARHVIDEEETATAIAESAALTWAVERWRIEVEQRPLVNVHRRALDDTWRQVVRRFGGDPDRLLGPSHDVLMSRCAA